jgi:thiol-disulfide isomerase/thioredoxin
MHWPRISLLLLFSLFATVTAAEVERLEVGDWAPSIVAKTLQHGDFDLSSHQGELVLLQFWASWCQSCIAEMPNLAQLHGEFSEAGLKIISISVDAEPKDARRAVSQYRMIWPQVVEGLGKKSPIATAYGVHGTPYFVLIGRDGRILDPVVKPSELTERVRSALSSK